jgi:hypothetical protein
VVLFLISGVEIFLKCLCFVSQVELEQTINLA